MIASSEWVSYFDESILLKSKFYLISSTALGSQSLAYNFLIYGISFKYLTDLKPVAASASNKLIPSIL